MGQITYFKIIFLTIIITKIWALSLYVIFGTDSNITNSIINDSFHHYQVGLLFILVGFILQRIRKSYFIFCVGIGIFLEEWPVFLADIGFNTKHLYHSGYDLLLVLSLVLILYFLFMKNIRGSIIKT